MYFIDLAEWLRILEMYPQISEGDEWDTLFSKATNDICLNLDGVVVTWKNLQNISGKHKTYWDS